VYLYRLSCTDWKTPLICWISLCRCCWVCSWFYCICGAS